MAWVLSVPSRSAVDAVRHWWPDAAGAERERLRERVKKWVQRARRAAGVDADPDPEPVEVETPEPAPPLPHELHADATREAFLRGQKALLEEDLDRARAAGVLRAIATLDRVAQWARGRLEDEIAEQRGRPVVLPRSELGLAQEIESRRARLEALANAWRCAVEEGQPLPSCLGQASDAGETPRDAAAARLTTLLEDLQQARAAHDATAAASLHRRVGAARDELDEGGGAENALTLLCRSPGEVAARILDRLPELGRRIAEIAEDLEWLDRVSHAYPLAVAILWEAPLAPWDQRRSVIAAMECPTVCVVLGGERSGKSTGQKHLTLAEALGSDEPCVQHWLHLNRLPHTIPPDPNQTYMLAGRSGDSVRYHRPDFDMLAGDIPKRWTNRDNKGEAILELQTTRYRQPARVWFLSVVQGPDAMQGISLRRATIDEEPLGIRGEKVYRHLRGRVVDQDGRIAIAMVPSEGLTWVHDKLVIDRQDDAVIVELDSLNNPHLPRQRAERHFDAMDELEVDVRRFGRFRRRSGLVYPMFTLGDGARDGPGHVCDPFEIPASWLRWRGADFGLVAPTAVVWGALGDDETLYVYLEHYEAGPTYEEHGLRVRELEAGQLIQGGWGDPSAEKAIDMWASMDIYVERANNAVKFGIDVVRNRMRLQADNRPRIKIFSTCVNLIRELQGYVWDDARKDDSPLKRHDHASDALRYLCVGIEEWKGVTAW